MTRLEVLVAAVAAACVAIALGPLAAVLWASNGIRPMGSSPFQRWAIWAGFLVALGTACLLLLRALTG